MKTTCDKKYDCAVLIIIAFLSFAPLVDSYSQIKNNNSISFDGKEFVEDKEDEAADLRREKRDMLSEGVAEAIRAVVDFNTKDNISQCSNFKIEVVDKEALQTNRGMVYNVWFKVVKPFLSISKYKLEIQKRYIELCEYLFREAYLTDNINKYNISDIERPVNSRMSNIIASPHNGANFHVSYTPSEMKRVTGYSVESGFLHKWKPFLWNSAMYPEKPKEETYSSLYNDMTIEDQLFLGFEDYLYERAKPIIERLTCKGNVVTFTTNNLTINLSPSSITIIVENRGLVPVEVKELDGRKYLYIGDWPSEKIEIPKYKGAGMISAKYGVQNYTKPLEERIQVYYRSHGKEDRLTLGGIQKTTLKKVDDSNFSYQKKLKNYHSMSTAFTISFDDIRFSHSDDMSLPTSYKIARMVHILSSWDGNFYYRDKEYYANHGNDHKLTDVTHSDALFFALFYKLASHLNNYERFGMRKVD